MSYSVKDLLGKNCIKYVEKRVPHARRTLKLEMSAAREVVALDSCAGVVPDNGLEFEMVTWILNPCRFDNISVHQHVTARDSSKKPQLVKSVNEVAADVFITGTHTGGDSTLLRSKIDTDCCCCCCASLHLHYFSRRYTSPGGVSFTLYLAAHPSILFSGDLATWRPVFPVTYRIELTATIDAHTEGDLSEDWDRDRS